MSKNKKIMKYKKFRYIYPPRPKNAIAPVDLNFWDNGSLIAQPKLNGSNALIFTNGKHYYIMNRHGERLNNFKIKKEELREIYKGNGEWMIINGEYMNKSKLDENGNTFNDKFVIFDILAFEGEHLVRSTFSDRLKLMSDLYDDKNSEKEYLFKISDNIYRVKSYSNQFNDIFNEFIGVDMLEGLVMKRKNAKLEIGNSALNNTKSQLKCRKPTKNYKY